MGMGAFGPPTSAETAENLQQMLQMHQNSAPIISPSVRSQLRGQCLPPVSGHHKQHKSKAILNDKSGKLCNFLFGLTNVKRLHACVILMFSNAFQSNSSFNASFLFLIMCMLQPVSASSHLKSVSVSYLLFNGFSLLKGTWYSTMRFQNRFKPGGGS